jgi:hypothetical protein
VYCSAAVHVKLQLGSKIVLKWHYRSGMTVIGCLSGALLLVTMFFTA